MCVSVDYGVANLVRVEPCNRGIELYFREGPAPQNAMDLIVSELQAKALYLALGAYLGESNVKAKA